MKRRKLDGTTIGKGSGVRAGTIPLYTVYADSGSGLQSVFNPKTQSEINSRPIALAMAKTLNSTGASAVSLSY